MTVAVVHIRGAFLSFRVFSLDCAACLGVFYLTPAEYGAIECNLGVLYSTLSAIKDRMIVAGYLHFMKEDGIMFFL